MGGARLGPRVGAVLTGSGGGWCRAKTQGHSRRRHSALGWLKRGYEITE